MTTAAYARTEPLSLDALTPFPGNAKRGDVPTILESLCRNGQYRSLIVRDTGAGGPLVVLAGNHTLQGIAAHGPGPCGLTVRVGGVEQQCALCGGEEWEPTARCEIITCDDATARRINLVDNKSAENGTYDETALAELLLAVDGDLGGTGYSDTDLAELLENLPVPEDEEEPYDDEEDEEDPPAPAAAAQAPAQPSLLGPAPVPGPLPGVLIPAFVEPSAAAPLAPPAPGHVQLVLAYAVEDRDEVTRLIAAARDGGLPDASASEVVLRGLRALLGVLDSRHSPDATVSVASLLRAAGVDPS